MIPLFCIIYQKQMARFDTRLAEKNCYKIQYKTYLIYSKTMPSFRNTFLLCCWCTKFISNILSASGIYDAEILCFCFSFGDTLKNICDRIFLSNISRMKMYKYLWLCKWLSQFLSRISQSRRQILLWIIHKGASIVL